MDQYQHGGRVTEALIWVFQEEEVYINGCLSYNKWPCLEVGPGLQGEHSYADLVFQNPWYSNTSFTSVFSNYIITHHPEVARFYPWRRKLVFRQWQMAVETLGKVCLPNIPVSSMLGLPWGGWSPVFKCSLRKFGCHPLQILGGISCEIIILSLLWILMKSWKSWEYSLRSERRISGVELHNFRSVFVWEIMKFIRYPTSWYSLSIPQS